MADKSFGVKELNLLNASGTPTITSPNNLNLNANNVAISTNVTVGQNITISANAGIASLNVTGISTFAGGINVSSGTLDIATQIKKSSGTLDYLAATHTFANAAGSTEYFRFASAGQLGIAGANYGTSGQVLTSQGSSSAPTWTTVSSGISTSPSNVQATWKLGGGSGSGFTFTGPGQDGSEGNPDIYLVRGQRYLFDNTTLAGNHPFEFRNAANNADYTDGVSGAQNGLQYINVQHDAPAQLKYRCTIHTNSMLGDIYIIGGEQVIAGDVTLQGASGKNFLWDNSAGDLYLNDNGSGASAKLKIGSGGDLQLYHDVGGANHIVCATNQELKLSANQFSFYEYTGVNRRLLLDSNGDLGLGIAPVPQDTGARTLHIHDSDSGNAARAGIRLTHGSSGSSASNGAFIGLDINPDFYLYNQEDGNIRFGVDGGEGMRLTKNANGTKALYVNLTSEVSGANSHVVVNNAVAVVSGSTFRSMYMSGNGSVYWWNGTNQPYISSGGIFTNASDISLKKDITDLTYGIDVLKNLKPRKYKMKADDKEQIGFIAQEVETAVPEVVEASETPNGDQHKGLAYGNLTAVLTKALQEAITKIETLEAKVAALESS